MEHKYIYTGIGSRKTPPNILRLMTSIASVLEQRGGLLRSGGAEGADLAFENGVIDDRNKEIFVPRPNYRPGKPNDIVVRGNIWKEAMDLAASIHPAWHRCSDFARMLHARNCFQVLGADLKTPSNFVIYWAPINESGMVSGGTATAVNLAKKNGIRTLNLLDEDIVVAVRTKLGI